jgi:hypothetical protein
VDLCRAFYSQCSSWKCRAVEDSGDDRRHCRCDVREGTLKASDSSAWDRLIRPALGILEVTVCLGPTTSTPNPRRSMRTTPSRFRPIVFPAAHLPTSVPGFRYCGGTVRNLWKMHDIENRSSFHCLLDFGKLVDRDLRGEHTHLARVHPQLNAWSGGGITLTVLNWSLYFVIVYKRGECAGFKDSNLQTGLLESLTEPSACFRVSIRLRSPMAPGTTHCSGVCRWGLPPGLRRWWRPRGRWS